MTLKEAEHWLVDNDFRFNEASEVWEHRFSDLAVSDSWLGNDREATISFVKRELAKIARRKR